jgi:para-nitrobenzyl esterase
MSTTNLPEIQMLHHRSLTVALLSIGLLATCVGGRASAAGPAPAAAAATAPTGGRLVSTVAPGDYQPGPRRDTTLGPIRGLRDATTKTLSWRGIPFAEPPVGNRRWKPPVTHRPWTAVRRTTAFGQGCPQPGRFFSPSPDGPRYSLKIRDGLGKAVGREDCLTLNVYRPATKQRHLPVLFFIHGGSNTVGYSGDPLYDGRRLARRTNSVVVTVNYRLGFFGWFNHDALKNGNPINDSANFATLDQIEALRFVRRNAHVFGGDPGNVTVAGESAGAVNVWALMVSPLTKGLFHKAIPMSGGFSFTSKVAAKRYADLFTEAVLSEAVPGEDTSDPIAYMRSKSARYLQALALRHAELDKNPPAVIPDGAVLPENWRVAVGRGEYRQIPVLAGNTFEEGKLFGGLIGAYTPTDYDRFTMMHEFDPEHPTGEIADYVKPIYLPATKLLGWNNVSAAIGDAVFTPPIVDSMNEIQAAGSENVFYYEFGWNEEPKPFDTVYGAVHGMDIPFVFRTFANRSVYSFAFSKANRPGRLELSDLMMRGLARFMRTGSPQHKGIGRSWKQWPHAMVLDADRSSAFSVLRPRLDTQAQHAQALNDE